MKKRRRRRKQQGEQIELIAEIEDTGTRLDVFINKKVETLSRSRIHKLIEEGMVRVNGIDAKPSMKVKDNQAIVIVLPEPKKLELSAEDISIEILYEDNDIIVVNKPKGLVVHPACGNASGTLVNALLFKCGQLSSINGVVRPGIVHRIDKDTSGVLVVAKNDNSHNGLSQQLKEHSIKRTYIALVNGNIKTQSGVINAPIGRHKVERKKMAVVDTGGRYAVTRFQVLENINGYTLIKAILETGRTHQIRVHMSYIGFPLVGDEVYGLKKPKLKVKGQMLHAEVLGFIHPATGNYMEFKAPIPDEFREVLDKLSFSHPGTLMK